MIKKNTNMKSIVTWNVENVQFEKSLCKIANFNLSWLLLIETWHNNASML